MTQGHGHATQATKPHPPYPGPYVDANSLKANGDFKDDQAITDALFIVTNGALACVQNDTAQEPRVPNVPDDAYAQSIGGYSYMLVDYGYAQHPPSASVAATVSAYVTWAAANLHQGHHA